VVKDNKGISAVYFWPSSVFLRFLLTKKDSTQQLYVRRILVETLRQPGLMPTSAQVRAKF